MNKTKSDKSNDWYKDVLLSEWTLWQDKYMFQQCAKQSYRDLLMVSCGPLAVKLVGVGELVPSVEIGASWLEDCR